MIVDNAYFLFSTVMNSYIALMEVMKGIASVSLYYFFDISIIYKLIVLVYDTT